MSSLVKDWNEKLASNRTIIEAANQQLREQYNDGKIDPREYLAAYQPVPEPLKLPNISWAKSFLRTWGWSLLSRQSDAQAALPFEHADMVAARAKVAKMTSEEKVHEALIINFDQLWRACWQWGGKLLYKDRANTAKRTCKKAAPKRLDKKLRCVKGARRSVTVPRFDVSVGALIRV